MKEILFRGKKKDTGKWAEGYYVKSELLNCNGSEHSIIEYDKNGETHNIIPETVCQYIGKCDKNGNKIFEGDILKLRTGRICKVVYESNNSFCGFTLVHISGLEYPSVSFGFYRNCEVIGNIYDNVILPSMESLKPEYCEKCGQRLDWRKEYE